jgi:spermidine synthase
MAGRFTGRIVITVALLFAAVAEGAVRHRSQSAHNQITVEDKGGYRMLRFNGSMETRLLIANPLLGHFEYTDYFQMPLLWNPKAKRVLVMGLGGGSTQRAFQHYFPTVHMDTVELDPAVAKVAKEWFGVKENKTHKIHISDGRGYLRRNKERKYDAIMMDAYSSNTYGSFIPYHLATKEFFQLAAEDLTVNGVLAYNVIGTYNEWRADIVGSMYRTMKTVFPHVYHFPAADSRNIVLVGVKAKTGGLTSATLRARLDLLRRAQPRLPAHFGPRLGRIQANAPLSAAKSPVLTDDHAPISKLLVPAR